MEKRLSKLGVLVGVLVIAGWLAPAFAGEVVIAGSKNLACRNVFKADQIVVDDLSFEPGGFAKGLPGDGDEITLLRPNEYAKEAGQPDTIAAGIAVDKPAALTVDVSLWCMQDTWDYGRLAVYWNDTLIGIANSKVGEKKHRQTFSFKVAADKVKSENCLWLEPLDTYTPHVYFDAAKVTGDAALKFLDAKQAKDLLQKVHPMFAETRDLKGKGNALVVNESMRTFGLPYYEVLKAMNVDAVQKAEWVNPKEWKDYKLVIVAGRWVSKEGDAEAIGEYLNAGGNLIMSSEFAQYFATGKGTAWDKIPWTGGYRAGWSRHVKPEDHFFGVVAQDSPLLAPGMKAGMKLEWYPPEMARFVAEGKVDEKEILINVDSTESPLRGNNALFIHPVGQGKLIGFSDTNCSRPDMVVTLRNIVASVLAP